MLSSRRRLRERVSTGVGPCRQWRAEPVLFRLLVETAISGTDAPVPALERDYVRAIRAEPDPTRKLMLYAQAIGRIQQRLAPLVQVLQQAAAGDAELAASGALRPELSVEEVADVLWSMNSPELYLLLVGQRGWDPDRYQRWLADAWQRLLLRPA
jgi:hypothetical protein